MEVADIATGRFVFRPRPNKPVSLSKLQKEIKNAGYEISGTRIEVAGALTDDGRLRVPGTGQIFRLEGEEKLRELRTRAAPDGTVTAAGVWATKDGEEVVRLEEAAQTGERRP